VKTIRRLAGASLISLFVAACGGGSNPQGGLRQACYGNGTCNAGLTCISQICVAAGGTGGTNTGGTMGSGGSAGMGAGGTTGSGGSAGTGVGGGAAGAGGATARGGAGGSGGSTAGVGGAGGNGGSAGTGGTTGAGGSGLPTCSGELYDACNTASDNCASGACQPFQMGAVTVCTQSCASPSDCPNQNGQAVACGGIGLCKPTAPNSTCIAP